MQVTTTTTTITTTTTTTTTTICPFSHLLDIDFPCDTVMDTPMIHLDGKITSLIEPDDDDDHGGDGGGSSSR